MGICTIKGEPPEESLHWSEEGEDFFGNLEEVGDERVKCLANTLINAEVSGFQKEFRVLMDSFGMKRCRARISRVSYQTIVANAPKGYYTRDICDISEWVVVVLICPYPPFLSDDRGKRDLPLFISTCLGAVDSVGFYSLDDDAMADDGFDAHEKEFDDFFLLMPSGTFDTAWSGRELARNLALFLIEQRTEAIHAQIGEQTE